MTHKTQISTSNSHRRVRHSHPSESARRLPPPGPRTNQRVAFALLHQKPRGSGNIANSKLKSNSAIILPKPWKFTVSGSLVFRLLCAAGLPLSSATRRSAVSSLLWSLNVESQLPPRIKPLTRFCSFSDILCYIGSLVKLTVSFAPSATGTFLVGSERLISTASIVNRGQNAVRTQFLHKLVSRTRTAPDMVSRGDSDCATQAVAPHCARSFNALAPSRHPPRLD